MAALPSIDRDGETSKEDVSTRNEVNKNDAQNDKVEGVDSGVTHIEDNDSPIIPIERRADVSNDRASFWKKEVVRILRRLLELASYYPQAVEQHISTYTNYVIPHLGPSPPEFAAYTFKPSSIMLDDHGPSELGWAIDSRGMIVRFYAEPLSALDGSPAPRSAWIDILSAFVRGGGQADADLTWAQICIDTLTCEPAKDQYAVGSGTSQFIIGADLEKNGLVGKAYFWPTLLARTSGRSNTEIVGGCLDRLGLSAQWETITSYLSTLPAAHDATPEVVAVSTVSPTHNGAKIYLRTNANTLADLLPYLTLGGAPELVNDEGVQSALDALRRFWRLLFPGVQEHTPVGSANPEFWASGILVYYDLAPGRAHPLPKLFIDVRHRCGDDAQIARAVAGYFRETGDLQKADWYEEEVRGMFRHRALEERTGIHTSVGVGVKKTGPRITLYFSPEVFSPRSSKG